jgi:hypothetical protein
MLRRAALIALVTACSSPPRPPPRKEPPITPTKTVTCTDAGAALEKGTVAIRAPGTTILAVMRARCSDDAWPGDAVRCFAQMSPRDAVDHALGVCAGLLPREARDRMFDVISGGTTDGRVAIAISRARLAALSLPVPACERFVATVANVLECEHIPLEVRVQLGNEASDFWSLPTTNLPATAQREMAAVCTDSLGKLQRQAQDAGCMP